MPLVHRGYSESKLKRGLRIERVVEERKDEGNKNKKKRQKMPINVELNFLSFVVIRKANK